MPQLMRTTLLPLAFVLAVVATACAEPSQAEVEMGSGVRFLPEVADPLNDAGRYASVATTEDGLPVVAYFGFQEELVGSELPLPRPIGSPSLPGVMLATVSDDGYWTRGAIAIAEQITNVTVAFNPAFEPTVADLTRENVTGLSLIAEGGTYHAAWGSAAGVYYATGSLDPSTTTQATVSQVSNVPGLGLSLAVDAGRPRLAFYTSTSSLGTVNLATLEGDGWLVESIAEGGGCETCRTAVLSGPEMAVAYSVPGGGVELAANDGENGWVSFEVASEGGSGLSGTRTADGLALAYYVAERVGLASGPLGSMEETVVAEVAEGSADLAGARTAVAADGAGGLTVAWVDAGAGIGIAVGGPGALEAVDTTGSTEGGTFPAVATVAEPAVTYLAWYDVEPQDALVGGYGEFGDVPFAQPSPTPTAPIATPAPPPSEECTPVVDGRVTVVAEGITFSEGSCIEVTAGESFTITFDNRDAGTQHNIQISNDPEPTPDLLFEGEIITGPAQIDYEIPAFDSPSEYAFACVVHPNMVGKVNVVETQAGTGEGGGGGGTPAIEVSASNLAFDTSTIELTSGEPATITFTNDDAGVQHDIAIYEDDTLAVELFKGEIITGPDEIGYEIPALDPGTYYFLCLVHPTMNGSVVVT